MSGGDPAARTVDAYLARLEAELAEVPAPERREIVLETRSHLLERLQRDPSSDVGAVLHELGPAETYARRFLPERSPPAGGPMPVRGIARLASGRWTGLPLLFGVALAYGVAAAAFLLAVDKLLEPHATGLVVSGSGPSRFTGLVISDPRHGGRDLLGYWLVPIALAISVSIHLGVSALLRRVATPRQS